jgi:VWFA-related protein
MPIGFCPRTRAMAAGVFVVLSLQPGLRGGQQQPFVERVDVARILIDALVVDQTGKPLRGLVPSDFAVTIDGRSASVESVEWFGRAHTSADGLCFAVDALEQHSAASGRLIVFLVQKTLLASPAVTDRDVSALMRTLQLTDPLLASLVPQDRVAVLSFDSHLRIWSDFTNDFTLVGALLQRRVIREHPPSVTASPGASLVSRLNQGRGRTVHTMEEALQLIGNALEPLPGPKIIVLLGYGFGKPDALKRSLAEAASLPGFLNHEYKDALAALVKARASVFSLDVTDAHRHALEVGLQAVAADTGGFFARTNLFPDQAFSRVADALAGHYILFVEKPAGKPAVHRVNVKLNEDRKGTVHAPRMYVDPSSAQPDR